MGTTLCLAPWGQPVVAATDDIRTNGLTCLVGTCSSAKPRKGGQFFTLVCMLYIDACMWLYVLLGFFVCLDHSFVHDC